MRDSSCTQHVGQGCAFFLVCERAAIKCVLCHCYYSADALVCLPLLSTFPFFHYLSLAGVQCKCSQGSVENHILLNTSLVKWKMVPTGNFTPLWHHKKKLSKNATYHYHKTQRWFGLKKKRQHLQIIVAEWYHNPCLSWPQAAFPCVYLIKSTKCL